MADDQAPSGLASSDLAPSELAPSELALSELAALDPLDLLPAWRRRSDDASGLRRRLAETEEELNRVADQAALAEERARLHEADAAAARRLLAEARARASALSQSTCWRMTWPLRALAAPVMRALARARTAPAKVEAIRPTARRAARAGRPAPGFPLPGEVAVHPALLTEPAATLSRTVSVIIPTLNAGDEFHWLLRKLLAQRGLGGVDIIVVDSGSSDGTPERAAALGCRVLPIDPEKFSHSAARNLGASVAAGDLLLFMVQDAYPVGDFLLAGLARCLVEPRREQDRLAAVSCAEFCRADSELIYDAMARVHYEFLGCAAADRVGRLTTTGHAALRQQGQLSDVACLIPRETFQRFLFQGRYAEDLTLGIRLIERGLRVGMLSSIRVIHSHRRPASYYVRRVFVDVAFLAGVFEHFEVPPVTRAVGALVAVFAMRRALLLAARRARGPALPPPAEQLDDVIALLSDLALPRRGMALPDGGDFGFAPLGAWMARLLRAAAVVGRVLSPIEQRGAAQFRAMAVDRLAALRPFVAQSWPVADADAARELADAVDKTLAMSLGAQLAYCHLRPPPGLRDEPVAALLAELPSLLLAGI